MRLRLNPETASLGFLMLHIVESQLSLAKLFFEVAVDYQPTMAYAAVDEGQEIPLDLIQKTLDDGRKIIQEMIENTPENQWEEITETRFGSLSRFDATICSGSRCTRPRPPQNPADAHPAAFIACC